MTTKTFRNLMAVFAVLVILIMFFDFCVSGGDVSLSANTAALIFVATALLLRKVLA